MWCFNPLTIIETKLDQLYTLIQTLTGKVDKMANQFDAGITALQGDVAALTTVVAGAKAAFAGLAQQLADALAAAQAAGATPAELQAITDLHTSLTAQTDALAAAVATVPPVVPPVTP